MRAWRALLVAALLILGFLPAEGAPPRVLRFPFWACSDGKGTISLFWLPLGGQWPAGGYRLERVARGRTTVLGAPFRPGQDARSMMEIDPADADAIRSLADKIEKGTLTDDEMSGSISVLGRAASADILLGRALGVRHTDVPKARGKLFYRLTALGADGSPGSAMESAEVDPGKPTPPPGRPAGLRAEEQANGVALFWTDPPASPVSPVVGFRVNRADGGKRTAALTSKPLLLNRHLSPGRPEFLDGAAPAKKIAYQVRSVDVFGRASAPVQIGITAKNVARAKTPSGPGATAPGATAAGATAAGATAAGATSTTPAATSSPPPRVATAQSSPGPIPTEPVRKGIDAAPPAPVRDETPPAAPSPPSQTRLASAAGDAVPPDRDRNAPSARVPAPPPVRQNTVARANAAVRAPAAEAPPAPEPPPSPAPTATARTEPPPQPAPDPPPPAKKTADIVWAPAKAEPAGGHAGPPPPPTILGVQGMGDRVVIRFRPGEPEGVTHEFLVFRSESPTGTGVAVGRPIPGNTREWEDTTVSAGQYFWYRLVAVDGAGIRGTPSKPKWVSTGSR